MHLQSSVVKPSRMTLLKTLFWAYFLLLIFEGALRKWLLPGFSTAILLIRDPVALLILMETYRKRMWPQRWSLISGLLAVGLISLYFVQIAVTDNPWYAGLYGLRSYLLPFLVAFAMGENLSATDLRQFGVCTVVLMLPETALEVAQYLMPTSILNVGAYEGAAQIAYEGAHVRASGTFSFVIGPALYGPLAAAFIFYGLTSGRFTKKWLLWLAAFALIVSVPVVGSRAYIFELAAVVVCAGISAFSGVTQFIKLTRILIPVVAIFTLVSLLPVFSEASNSMSDRWHRANETEGGGRVQTVLVHRLLLPFEHTLNESDFSRHPFGIGMGRGSNAMTKVMLGKSEFVAGEDEFSQMVIELGLVPGFLFMLFRIFLASAIAVSALLRLRGIEPLALLLAPLMFSQVIMGTLEQPTGQGFMVIYLAFSLSALKLGVTPARTVQPFKRISRPRRYSDARA